MPRYTKAYKVADYDRLHDHAELLELYLYDTQQGRKPDATESYKDAKHDISVRCQLWRASGAAGGYVVIVETMPNIWTLDEAIQRFSSNASEYSLGLRICLERLAATRNRMNDEVSHAS